MKQAVFKFNENYMEETLNKQADSRLYVAN